MVEHLSRAAAFALLLYVAAQLLFRQPPKASGKQALELSARDAIATFLAGVSTAVTNPITAAFFASQFFGALPNRATRILALGLVPCLAMSFGVTLGFALSRPFAQRAATVWHRPIRFLAAAVLATTALIVATPLLRGPPDIEPGSTASAGQVIERPLQAALLESFSRDWRTNWRTRRAMAYATPRCPLSQGPVRLAEAIAAHI